MIKGLIGYTGTVGQSILDVIPDITYKYNSKNISDIHNMQFDVLYIAGVSANKWFANSNNVEDLANIKSLLNDLKTVKAKQVILISTIDIDYFPNEPYSINREFFEFEIQKMFSNTYVIRLPGLIGKHIKKNFIYDCKHMIPKFFKDNLDPELWPYYQFDGKVYSLKDNVDKDKLLPILVSKKLTALRFTNANSVYQFFDLSNIKEVILIALNNDIRLLKVSSYPISTREICLHLNIDHTLLGSGTPIVYDKLTDFVLLSKEAILQSITTYMEG